MSVLRLKQGEAFSVNMQYLEADRVTPKSLAGVTILSLIRDTNFVVHATLDVTVTDNSLGLYTLTAPLGTSDWPAGILLWDVNYNNGDVDPTVAIEVLRTESLSNSSSSFVSGGSDPLNILSNVNFTIDPCRGGTWQGNAVFSNNFTIRIYSVENQNRPAIKSKITVITELQLFDTLITHPMTVSILDNASVVIAQISATAGHGKNVFTINLPYKIPIVNPDNTEFMYSIFVSAAPFSVPPFNSLSIDAVIIE